MLNTIEMFTSRVQVYIYTYHHIAEEQQRLEVAVVTSSSATTTSTAAPIAPKQDLIYTEIERLMKAFMGVHRCAPDFDRGIVNSELKAPNQGV
jgi:hypothetical protein